MTLVFLLSQILCMSAEEFGEFRENEGWEEAEEDEEEKITQALCNEGLPGLPAPWRRLLRAAAGFTLASFREDLQKDRAMLENAATLTSRQQRALQVRCGQKTILNQLMELTKP